MHVFSKFPSINFFTVLTFKMMMTCGFDSLQQMKKDVPYEFPNEMAYLLNVENNANIFRCHNNLKISFFM